MSRTVEGALMALAMGIFFGTSAGANTLYFQLEPISIGDSSKLFIFGPPACTGVVKTAADLRKALPSMWTATRL